MPESEPFRSHTHDRDHSGLLSGYIHCTSLAHRRRLGQFFTPPAVAEFMLRWTLKGGKQTCLDPAFGLGAFYLASRHLDPLLQMVAVECDPWLCQWLRRYLPLPSPGLELMEMDYFALWGRQFPAIVCNPPYMRFQKIQARQRVLAILQQQTGLRLSGYLNLSAAFLIKSVSELSDGGRLSYLMPLEFLNTGYGRTIKQWLLKQGILRAIFQIVPEQEIFPEAITSVGILLAAREEKTREICFGQITSMEDFQCHPDIVIQSSQAPATVARRWIPVEKLDPAAPWNAWFATTGDNGRKRTASRLSCEDIRCVPSESCPDRQWKLPGWPSPDSMPSLLNPETGVAAQEANHIWTLSSYGCVRRGIATGANAWFVLSRSKALDWGIPPQIWRLCLSHSRQVRSCIMTESQLEKLLVADEDILLPDFCQGNTVEQVQRYVAWGEQQKIHTRHLTSQRRPWFRLEKSLPSPLWVGVFSRGGCFKVIRNFTSALTLTCFHVFFPNSRGNIWVDQLFLYLCSPAGQRAMAERKRTYGRSLDKLEPGDLGQVRVPPPDELQVLSPEKTAILVQSLEESGKKEAGKKTVGDPAWWQHHGISFWL